MSRPRYRAWRFLVPVSGMPEDTGGLQATPTGKIAMVQREASVRQSLLLLLSTTPGERVMRPEYGCDLRELIFAGNDETAAGLAMHYVRRAVERWEPRVEILRMDARPSVPSAEASDNAAGGTLEIVLDYRVRGMVQPERLTYQLDLV